MPLGRLRIKPDQLFKALGLSDRNFTFKDAHGSLYGRAIDLYIEHPDIPPTSRDQKLPIYDWQTGEWVRPWEEVTRDDDDDRREAGTGASADRESAARLLWASHDSRPGKRYETDAARD